MVELKLFNFPFATSKNLNRPSSCPSLNPTKSYTYAPPTFIDHQSSFLSSSYLCSSLPSS